MKCSSNGLCLLLKVLYKFILLFYYYVIVTELKPLRCFDGKCFCHFGCILAIFEMADGIAIVADGIATFVMTDVIVIVEMEYHFV